MHIAILYPTLIFSNFYDEPGIMFCGFDISIKGETYKFMVELENDYYLLKKLCEESQSFGFPEVIDILQQFNFQREVKKYERFVSNYREFSKNKLFETYEYLKLKDLSNKNEFKSFVLRYGNSNEKIDFGKKNKSVKKDDLHNKENVKKEIDDKEMFLTILLPSHTG